MVKESMLQNINRQLSIVLDDDREMTGKLLVYDRHMNVVLSDVVETRPETKKMRDANISPKRNLGLVLLRGEHIISVKVENGREARPANFEKAPKEKAAGTKRARLS